MVRDTRDGVPKHHAWGRGDQGEVGAFLHGYDSLWLPESLLQKSRQKQLTEGLFAASRHLERVDGLILHIRDADMLDGTPVLDLKPY